MRQVYSLNDILLIPRYSDLSSRSVVDLSTNIGGFYGLDIPILSAPMSTVTEHEMAIGMAQAGGMGILHRYLSVEDMLKESQLIYNKTSRFSVAINTDKERTKRLLRFSRNSHITIDIAHGGTKTAIDTIKYIRKEYGDMITIIGANVVTPGALADVADLVEAVRVGIGEGSACTTRRVAGTGVPLASALMDLVTWQKTQATDVKLIVDGGVKNTGDIVKCLALGADAVITGSLLVGTDESPAPIWFDKRKEYFGMGSERAMEMRQHRDPSFDYDSSIHTSAPEGKRFYVNRTGSLKDVLTRLINGIKIGFAYQGARNIEELQRNAEFVHVTDH